MNNLEQRRANHHNTNNNSSNHKYRDRNPRCHLHLQERETRLVQSGSPYRDQLRCRSGHSLGPSRMFRIQGVNNTNRPQVGVTHHSDRLVQVMYHPCLTHHGCKTPHQLSSTSHPNRIKDKEEVRRGIKRMKMSITLLRP